MWKAGLILSFVTAASGSFADERAHFEYRYADFVARLEMPAQLPAADFEVVFSSPTDGSLTSEYEYAPSRDFDCHWHRVLPMICRQVPASRPDLDPNASDGRRLRAEQRADGVVRSVVYGVGDSAEFADFRGDRLEAFGFVDQGTGAITNLWRRQ